MGLLRKVNMLTSYLTEFVWTCFIKYVVLNIVCMTFCLQYSASAMTCVIGLTRLYYPNVTVIYIRNLLLIIVCSKMCAHWYVNSWCMHVCCVYFNKLNWIELTFCLLYAASAELNWIELSGLLMALFPDWGRYCVSGYFLYSAIGIPYRQFNQNITSTTMVKVRISNLEQVENLLLAQASSASYSQHDAKWVPTNCLLYTSPSPRD